MMKILKYISQLVIGLLFVFSGFVKAVDPLGFAIKFNDYLTALNIEFLSPIALVISIGLSALEFLIGIHILIGIRYKIVCWPLIILSIFFTLTTLYIALENPVSDCGCFGDAWKLTNWETFYKNLVLLPLSFIIFKYRNKHNDSIKGFRSILLSILFTSFIISISVYSLKHLPIIDFRPYHIGSSITEKMSTPPDAEKPVYETVFILEKDGQQKEFNVDNYPYNDSTWIFVDNKTTLIKEGYIPPIHDFSLQTINGDDITNKILNYNNPVFILVSYKLNNADFSNINAVINLHLQQKNHGYKFYILTSSMPNDIFRFDEKYGVGFDYILGDETVLKTIIRSNPGLILLNNGTIINKWNLNDVDAVPDFEYPLSKAISQQTKSKNKLTYLFLGLLLASIIIIIYKINKHN